MKAVGRDDSIVSYKEAEQFTTKEKHMDFLNSKAVRDLGHDPKVTPEEGIRRTVEWMKSIYNKIDEKPRDFTRLTQKREKGKI